ncbi:MAG: M48 family metallopeptidase [Bauldia sp.]
MVRRVQFGQSVAPRHPFRNRRIRSIIVLRIVDRPLGLLFRSRPPAPLPEHLDLSLGDRTVPVRLRANARARRYTLRVGRAGGEPVVTIPAGGSLGGARSFLERNRLWLERRLDARPQATPFAAGETIPFRGAGHVIRHLPARRGTVMVENGPDGPCLCVCGGEEHLSRRLVDWLKREAKGDLDRAVFRYSAMIGRKPTVIRLRDQKGRWGSCSSAGTLSFSWRLILAPPMVLDYLAAHEVTHLAEMNHSARFWRLLRRLCPDTDRAEAWLKAHGSSLHAYGAGDRG